jgi:hypothetical protein
MFYSEILRTQDIRSFGAYAVGSRVSPNWFFGPITTLCCNSRRLFPCRCAVHPADFTLVEQSDDSRANQNATDAKHNDGR